MNKNMVLSSSGQGHLVLSQVTTVRICIGLLKYTRLTQLVQSDASTKRKS